MKKYFVLSLFLVMALSTLLLNFACQPTVTGPGFPAALKTAIASYTPVPTGTQSPTSTPFPTATPCVFVMGDQVFESSVFAPVTTTLYLTQFVAGSTCNINSFSLGVTGGVGEFRGAIYADNGSGTSPRALLGETNPQSFTQGFNSAPFTGSVSVTSGDFYWIGFISQGNLVYNNSVTVGMGQQTGLSVTGSLPTTFTGTVSGVIGEISNFVCQ